MISAIIGFGALFFALMHLILKPIQTCKKNKSLISLVLSGVLTLASLSLFIDAVRDIQFAVLGKTISLSSNYSTYSTLAITGILFLSILAVIKSEFITRKSLFFSFVNAGLFILIINSQLILFTSILLPFSVISIYLSVQSEDRILNKNSSKLFILRLFGSILFLSGILIQQNSNDSNLFAYFQVFGLLVLMLTFPLSLLLSDYVSRLRLHQGLTMILFQFVIVYLTISNFMQFHQHIPGFTKFIALYSAISMLIVILIGISQRSLIRQFSYVLVFYSIFIVLMLSLSPKTLYIIKYLSLSITFILSFYWITLKTLISDDISNTNSTYNGLFAKNPGFMVLYLVSLLLLVGIPFTPVFYTFVNFAKSILTTTFHTYVQSSFTTSIVYIVIMFVSFLLLIYMLSTNFIKLSQSSNQTNSVEMLQNSINIGRNSYICLISLLILIGVLSILPVFFFQKLREDSHINVNISQNSHMRPTENNSSEGINEK